MTGLPPIQRPNGRLYRPRKIRVTGWSPEDWGEDGPPQTAVVGTHDVDLARRHARSGSTCHYLINPARGWVRRSMRSGVPWWVDDPETGAACVIFDESDGSPDEVDHRGGRT